MDASQNLATYELRRQPAAAGWFQEAIHQVVQGLHSSPFMQLVKLGEGATGTARFSTFRIDDSVVPAPEVRLYLPVAIGSTHYWY